MSPAARPRRGVLPDSSAPFVETLGAVPRAARWLLPVAAILRRGTASSTLERRLRALVTLRMAALDGAGYWLTEQLTIAPDVGILAAEVDAVVGGSWPELDSLSERERVALRWTDGMAVNEAKRDKAAFADLEELFDSAEIIELTSLVGLCAFLDRFANAMQLPSGHTGLSDDPQVVSRDELADWAGTMFEQGAR